MVRERQMKQGTIEKIKRAFIFWLARRLPDCKTIAPKLGESLDCKLSLKTRITLKLHMLTCRPCARYFEQIKYLSDAMHDCEERLVNDDNRSLKLSIDIKETLKDRIRAEMANNNRF
jgi:hypothetical protein